MPSDTEIQKTLERVKRVEATWNELETKMQEYERDKEAFAREFGVEYEKFLQFMSNQAEQVRSTADADTLAELERQTEEIQQHFEEEVSQAEARHAAEQQLSKGTSSKRARRMRDMI